MDVKITLDTPVWTGNVEGESKKLMPGGIIGSMRFWYELIQRGLGEAVCDPTDNGCQLQDIEKYDKLCPVCKLFGCSGYKRPFKLIIDKYIAEKIEKDFYTFDKKSDVIYQSMSLQFVNQNDNFDSLQLIKELLIFIASYGGIGAKIQYGFGKVQRLEIDDEEMDISGGYRFKQLFKRNNDIENELLDENVYNLQNYFSCTFRIDNSMNIQNNAVEFKKSFKESMTINSSEERQKMNKILFGDKKRAGTLFIALLPYKRENISVQFYGFINYPKKMKDILQKYMKEKGIDAKSEYDDSITGQEILDKGGVNIGL